MKYKVVLDSAGNMVSYGPNDGNYDPTIQPGQSLVLTDVLPNPSSAQIQTNLEQVVQGYLDSQARLKGYDNIVSACSYAAAPNPFQAEGISFLNWRAACWSYCYSLLAQVNAGTATIPTAQQLIAMLPVRV